ncbi:MAG: hypothetical protein PHR81_07040 [Bacteroidales bacterium]|jgi:hypothetical protein|nr:hypothetical protein [Bacteroidales bacterium]MDD4214551.1 hypothetical protein [Bacteroidales bacterium]
MRFLLFVFFIGVSYCFAQSVKDTNHINYIETHEQFIPCLQSTHPLGVFISRVQHNFQKEAAKKISFSFNVSSGNVWLPYVKAYKPVNESDKDVLSSYVWHERETYFDELNTPARTIEFIADGVIRLYQLELNIPLSANQELKINSRAISLDPGKPPFSLLTSDQFIEWFHSNIAGGEDPFGRKVHGLNRTDFFYKDENGKTLKIKNGDLVLTGIDISYYYYPRFNVLQKKGFYTNFGIQLGANLSPANPSMDIGINSSLMKQFKLRKKNDIHIGLSAGALLQKVLKTGEGVLLSNNNFIFTAELFLSYRKQIGTKSSISITTTYFLQSPYNKRKDFEYIVLTGDRIRPHWHYALSHLYRMLTCHNFIISYSRGAYSIAVYLREDLYVDNAPDSQTGIAFHIAF